MVERTRILVVFLMISLAAGAEHRQSENSQRIQAVRCEEVEQFHGRTPIRKGTLSPFWAQEYIGADLAVRSILEEEERRQKKFEPIKHAVVDSEFIVDSIDGLTREAALHPVSKFLRNKEVTAEYPHGTAVANIIAGTPPFGVGFRAKIAALIEGTHTIESPREHMRMMKEWLTSTKPQIITRSGNPRKEYLEFAKTTLWVNSTGNRFPARGAGDKDFPAIYVTNMESSGFIAGSSSENYEPDPLATVAAPSGYEFEGRGGITSLSEADLQFGGTSGAAPVVSGALSNALLFLGDISLANAKVLLEKTAVPILAASQKPARSGKGMVNALKLVEVAKRLERLGWKEKSEAERLKLLQRADVHDFSTVTAKDTASEENPIDIRALLKLGKEKVTNADCEIQREGMKLLRKAFLLSAGSSNEASQEVFEASRKLLAHNYLKAGLTQNADFFLSFDPDEQKRIIREMLPSKEAYTHVAAVRAAAIHEDKAFAKEVLENSIGGADHTLVEYLGEKEATAHIEKLLENGNTSGQLFYTLLRMGKEERIYKLFEEGDARVKGEVLYVAPLLKRGFEIMKQTIEGDDKELSLKALIGLYPSSYGERAIPILEKALDDSNPRVIDSAVWAAVYGESKKVYEKAMNHKSERVRVSFVSLAYVLEEKAFPYLKKALKDDSKDVQGSAVSSLRSLWKSGHLTKAALDADEWSKVREVLAYELQLSQYPKSFQEHYQPLIDLIEKK